MLELGVDLFLGDTTRLGTILIVDHALLLDRDVLSLGIVLQVFDVEIEVV